jgi:two-component system OmpR family response regulator
MEELDARVRALLRRKGKPTEGEIRFGGLTINSARRFASHDGVDIELARKEFAALECLVERDGRLIPKSQLIDHVYGIGTEVNEATIEVLISRLRKKLVPCGVEIKMARGLGYHLKAAD